MRDVPLLFRFIGRAIHRLIVFRFRWRQLTPEREQQLAHSLNPRVYTSDAGHEPPPPPAGP